MLLSLLSAAALAALPIARDTAAVPAAPHVTVTVDSVRHQVVVVAGPFNLPSMPADMDMSSMEHEPPQVMPFQWPVDGYMRGFDVQMRDAAGRELPHEILHHLIGVNFDRRQLIYDSVERLFGWGAETEKVELPASLGVPVARGSKLGVYAMFHNETGRDIPAAYLHVVLDYTPRRGSSVLAVMPFYVDVNNHIGGVTTFDVPPGKSSQQYAFEVPVGGRLVGIGGHLHDYGSSLELKDGASGKVLARLKAKRDRKGYVDGVGRFIFGFNNDALPLKAHHPYVVEAFYDNPTSDTVKDGGMGHINGAFVPDDMRQWPRLDPTDPLIQKDIAALPMMQGMESGAAGKAHEHEHRMPMPARQDTTEQMRNMPMDHEHRMDMTRMPASSDTVRRKPPAR